MRPKQQETTINVAPPVPLIRTFEVDLLEQVKAGEVSKLSIIAGEMDKGINIQSVADNTNKKRKYILIFVCFFIFAAMCAGGYYYYLMTKVVPVVKIDVKKYFIYDVWPGTLKDDTLRLGTGEATSTVDTTIININNFESIYPYIIENEDKLRSLAEDKYGYTNVGDFEDTTIENIDMRIADGNEGPVIYGYVDKKRLLISNDIGKYITKYKLLKLAK